MRERNARSSVGYTEVALTIIVGFDGISRGNATLPSAIVDVRRNAGRSRKRIERANFVRLLLS